MQTKTTTHWWIKPSLLVTALTVCWLIIPWLVGVKPVYLTSDILAFVLIVCVIYVTGFVRTKEHLLAPWREVFQRKLAMIAFVWILFYLLIALLDSIHFSRPLPPTSANDPVRYSIEVVSVLDVLAKSLKERNEETYSAPFATHLYSKKTIEGDDQQQIRDYPRLRYGGAHLQDPQQQRLPDVLMTLAGAFIISGGVMLLLAIPWIAALAHCRRRRWVEAFNEIRHGETPIPWREIYLTLGIIVFLLVSAVLLSADYHIFGTDKVGQNVFYMSLKSIRTGILIGTLATLIMLPFAILLGIMAGYFRGIADDIIQYIYTTLNSIPFVLLIAAAILSIHVYIVAHGEGSTLAERSDLRLVALCAILGVTSWTGLCRLLRGETLKIREIDYIQAATALGISHFRIMTRHILPNVMHIVLIAVVLDFSGLVLAEAVLSYVGVGVDQSTMSWGNMINSARLELGREPLVWWPLLAAFTFMFFLVLAANLFADAVRDAFDPKLRSLNTVPAK